MEERPDQPIKSFLIEMLLYSALVVGYVFVVLAFLIGWLKHLYDSNRVSYAIAALALMIGQAVVLELVTSLLLRLVSSRRD